MNFLNQLLQGIAFIPALVSGIEGLFGSKSGEHKKEAAMSFLQNALAMTDAVAQSRLGGGRLHHAMRTVGACQAALDMAGSSTKS